MSDVPYKPVQHKQTQLNDSTRGQWTLFESHRKSIERLLVASLPAPPGRLCVLGAGNCNDLDLHWLNKVFAEVHLVDLDPAALERAITRQKVDRSNAIRRHAPLELTGIASMVDAWRGSPPQEARDIEACAAQALRTPLAELSALGRFDVVLSPCVLSQLFTPVRDQIKLPSRSAPLLVAIRLRHLRLMADLLVAGGTGVFVTDLSSNEIFPPLPRVPPERVRDLMGTLLAEGKCFRHLDPRAVGKAIRSDAWLQARIGTLDWSEPWLWHLGLSRAYLVYGLTFRRNAFSSPATADSQNIPQLHCR